MSSSDESFSIQVNRTVFLTSMMLYISSDQLGKYLLEEFFYSANPNEVANVQFLYIFYFQWRVYIYENDFLIFGIIAH